MEKFDCIIVGAGLAGLATAYTLAKEGLEPLVIERGDYPGAKNVTGGRIYINPIRDMFPAEFWDKAPLERPVTTEIITMQSGAGTVSMRFRADEFAEPPYQSYCVQRAKFDRWFGSQATAAGAMLVGKSRFDDLIRDNGKIVGVIAGGEELGADVVVACDGVLSLAAEKAGLRKSGQPRDYAVGFKEVIELPAQTIEDRFGLPAGEGAAQLFMGSLSRGRFGGGFIYTNKTSLSLGMVVSIRDMMNGQPPVEPGVLLEEFKQRPEVAALIAGGEVIEYSAHVISEAGYNGITQLYGDGILVAGDAAGFSLNMGVTVRGMEFAIASGVIAARAIIKAREKKDYSAASLSVYRQLLEDSFVLKDLEAFKEAPHILDNPRFFSYYPELAGKVLRDIFAIGDRPKRKFIPTVRSHLGFSDITGILKDAWKGRKL